MDHLKLTMDALSVEKISDLVFDPSCGAVSIFVGTTRDTFEDKKVCMLDTYLLMFYDVNGNIILSVNLKALHPKGKIFHQLKPSVALCWKFHSLLSGFDRFIPYRLCLVIKLSCTKLIILI